MKKVLCFVLSALILVSSVSVALAAESDDALKFAVASDLHYNVPEEELTASGEIDDEIYWYANRRAAMENESGWIIDEFLNQCAEDDNIEFVLISGDLADNGKSIAQEHLDVAAKFKEFEEKTGKQIYVTVGNHDAGLDCATTMDDFKRIYHDFGYAEALTVVEDNCSYTANLGDKYRLISLDSCDPDKSTGDGMSAEKMDWVRKQAQQAKKDGRHPVLMMHHNLLDHMPVQSIFSKDFIVQFHYSTADLFANWGIKLVFTGHEHCSDAATYTSTIGNVIYDFATTSLTMYPLQYRYFEITDDEIKYEAKTVDKLDTEALSAAVRGYSQEQLDLMNAGLNAYSKGFLKAGVQWRLTRSLKMEQMGIAEDSIFYDLVNTAVGGLRKILEQPLYGEGGIQQLAAEYNIEIPDSSYKTGWDVALELVAAHYEGSESFDFNTTEVTIFLRLVALVLRDDLATLADEVFFEAANEIFKNFGTDSFITDITKLATKVLGGVTPVEYLLLAIVSPLVYSFAVDHDGVDDNNGILPGYGTVNAESNVSNVFDRIIGIFNDITVYFINFVNIIWNMIF
ncbi:MAG: metallophosphoesterase [Clostridia bacterium]|nr:metallophosphoesterase [Clostridia bacterium]